MIGKNKLKEKIEDYYQLAQKKQLNTEDKELNTTFYQCLELLEQGKIRSAEKINGTWQVNTWIKKCILLGFKLARPKEFNQGEAISFIDKDSFPLRRFSIDENIRIVPPAAGVRRGAFVGKNCVIMPPGYINTGVYVDENSMVEGLAGSCCQVGKHCHISAGVVIGGVLEPVEASPVILGDYVLLGENSGVTQGTILGDLVTLAPGVHISKATPVIDCIHNVAYTSQGKAEIKEINLNHLKTYQIGSIITEKDPLNGPVIPDGALIIPGFTVSSLGTPKITPMIVKYIKNKEERAYALEEALRG